jgi:hypothetical protein
VAIGRAKEEMARRPEPGLSLRLGRERRVISSQHRQLDDFIVRLAAALDAGEAALAQAALQRFTDALEAHLSLEDGLYFPALRGLEPRLESELAALSDEHHALREGLGRLARLADGGHCEACARSLARFTGELADHEGREEGLLAALRLGGNTR